MDETVGVTVSGMDELSKTLADLSKRYPDKAGELLAKDARALRKEVVEEVKRVKESSQTAAKMPLEKESSYRISPVQGYGADQYVEVSAKSPHFHLVEHGHVLTTGRKQGRRPIGFVTGKHMMANAVRKHQNTLPEKASDMVDELLKEAGLV